MIYHFIFALLLLPQVLFAGPFDAYKIKPQTQSSFYKAFHKVHPHGHIQKVIPLGGESIDQVFKISVLEDNTHTYFVRFLKRRGNDLNHEKIKITQAMADIWQGPNLIIQAKDNKSFITDFIQGRHPSRSDLKNPVLFKNFVNKLRQSHEYLKTLNKKAFPSYCMGARALRRLKEIKERSIILPNIGKVNEILQALKCGQEQARQVVHNDIRPENIMLDQENLPHLIDWAEVTIGNIFDDLGAFAEFFDLPLLMEKALIKQYFNEGASSANLTLLKIHRWSNGLHRAAFKFRKSLDALGDDKPTSWKSALNSDDQDLRKAAMHLKSYLEKVDDVGFKRSLEKTGLPTHISLTERVMLWLKTLVKDA